MFLLFDCFNDDSLYKLKQFLWSITKVYERYELSVLIFIALEKAIQFYMLYQILKSIELFKSQTHWEKQVDIVEGLNSNLC